MAEARGKRIVAAGCAIGIALSGCTAMRSNPGNCQAAAGLMGGALGAVAGGVGVNEIDSDPDNMARAMGAVVGFLVGGAAGLTVGHFACKPEVEVAAAPPPPAPAPTPVPRRALVLRGVHFDFDRATLRADARPVLDEAIRALDEAPDVRVSVEGHTDAVGTDAYNQALSERRARAVVDYLAAGGINAARLAVVGHGEEKPVASNDDADGRAQNRRVELRVVGEPGS